MKIRLLLVISAMMLMLVSCEITETTPFVPQITLNSYAYADSSLDSVFISRNGRVSERINMKNLGLSNVTAKLYENDALIGQLVQYSDRSGAYHLPDSVNFKFKIGKKYKLTASYPNYPDVYAETVCPDTLPQMIAKNNLNNQPMNNLGKADTIEYVPGENFLDNTYFKCFFDNTNMSGRRLALYQVAPEHREKSFWIEDTNKVVWDEYKLSVQAFKDKKQFGKDFFFQFNDIIYVNWLAFYSRGMHNIRFGSMDEAQRNYLVGTNDPSAIKKGNVKNGNGLFCISSFNKRVFRVFVKDDLPND